MQTESRIDSEPSLPNLRGVLSGASGSTTIDSAHGWAVRVSERVAEDDFAVLPADDSEEDALEKKAIRVIIGSRKLNDIQDLNRFLESVNEKLAENGRFIGLAETSRQRKVRLLARHPGWFGRVFYAADFAFKRVFPKLRLTRGLYLALTNGRNWVLPTAEILGRICRAGFAIEHTEKLNGRFYFVARKVASPTCAAEASYGPVFRMRRVGRHGKPIRVYKMRTMHPYAEYLQDYVYENGALDPCGKFRNDFRVTSWGRYLRRLWIDELPMLINWFRGELKLVGVRPLSEQYLSLYPPSFAERRSRYLPGLVPPYYADLPGDFEEILRSEEVYLDSYDESPFFTDLRYFIRALLNILLRGARSR